MTFPVNDMGDILGAATHVWSPRLQSRRATATSHPLSGSERGVDDAGRGSLGENGISIDMATPTAAPPGWLLAAHPEVLPVDQDMTQHWPGARLGWCPSNPTFRTYAERIVRAVAERYGHRDHVVMWHVSNELGGGNRRCYCDASAVAFRDWVKRK